MNSFDYLQKIEFGSYIPGESFFHKRNPGIRLAAFLVMLFTITFCNSIIGIGIFLLLLIATFLICKIPLQPIFRTLRSGILFILFIVILRIVIHTPQTHSILIWNWSIVHIYDTAIIEGFKVLLRLITLITCISFFSSIISSLEIIHGMEMLLSPLQKLGLNTNTMIMIVQIMLRFLPILAIRMEEISKSQASRGLEWDAPKGGLLKRIRLFFPLIIPLFISSLQQSERTTDAIISRAYGLKDKRSHYYRYSLNASDIVLITLVLVISTICLFPPISLL